jgi:hypothetical protein
MSDLVVYGFIRVGTILDYHYEQSACMRVYQDSVIPCHFSYSDTSFRHQEYGKSSLFSAVTEFTDTSSQTRVRDFIL